MFFYVLALHKNVISDGLLNKARIKLVFEYDNGDYVGKCYLSGALYMIETLHSNNRAVTPSPDSFIESECGMP